MLGLASKSNWLQSPIGQQSSPMQSKDFNPKVGNHNSYEEVTSYFCFTSYHQFLPSRSFKSQPFHLKHFEFIVLCCLGFIKT
jgi:hypothetical protein